MSVQVPFHFSTKGRKTLRFLWIVEFRFSRQVWDETPDWGW
jgi:hypothetical protein